MPPVIGWPTGDTHQSGLPRYVAPNSSVASRGSPVTTRAFRGLSGRADLANHSHYNLASRKEEPFRIGKNFHEDTKPLDLCGGNFRALF